MFGIHDFSLFLAAGILLNLTPGSDTVYILGRSLAQGRGAGVASALGICVGSIFHTSAAALGLSAILATSALAFSAIKLLGGAYLVFLGVKMLLDRRKRLSLPSHFRWRTTGAAFRQGVLTNILNPKVALFFLAFLPQFIDPTSNSKIAAFLALGLTFVTTGTIWCLILAWSASSLSARLRRNETIAQWVNRSAGADDYLVKPFAFAELLARVRALLRRVDSGNPLRQQVGDLTLDMQTRRVVRGSREIALTPREFDLLAFLAQHHDETVTRQMIAREVWREPNRATPLDNVIDVHLAHLRRKLDDGEDVKLIQTVRGVGFVFRAGAAVA